MSFIITIVLPGFSGINAKTTSKKVLNPSETLNKAREAFFNYDFEGASDLFDDYKEQITKAKQPADENLDSWLKELEVATNAFDRVQKIVIIDSLSVPREDFFKYYNLSKETGRLTKTENIKPDTRVSKEGVAYINDNEDFILTTELNRKGELIIKENYPLIDGSLEVIEALKGDFERSGDYNYPFMSQDGQTFYFSNNGEESMGGYDIFVAQRDPLTGEYLQPLNLGMPFNSPYDDLMLVLDEKNGVGWWATDRNSEEGKITIYTYILDEVRKNYPDDTEDLIDYAKITNYKNTWEEGKERRYAGILNNLKSSRNDDSINTEEIVFELSNGRIYHQFSDFKNKEALNLYRQYLVAQKNIERKEKELENYRLQYKTNKGNRDKILKLEEELNKDYLTLKKLKGEVILKETSRI